MAAKVNSTGSVPAEARSGASLNEAPSAAERSPDGPPVGPGPKRDPKTGGYLPATYPVSSGLRTDR